MIKRVFIVVLYIGLLKTLCLLLMTQKAYEDSVDSYCKGSVFLANEKTQFIYSLVKELRFFSKSDGSFHFVLYQTSLCFNDPYGKRL